LRPNLVLDGSNLGDTALGSIGSKCHHADAAGDMALAALTERAAAAGIEALALSPRLGDFNEDLRAFGPGELRAALRPRSRRRMPRDSSPRLRQRPVEGWRI
jgi:hypothetical protein